VIGSGIGGLPMIEETYREVLKSGTRRISPFFIPGTIINMVAGNLSIMYGLKGPNLAIVTACTTAAHCIGDAGRLIEYGDADAIIAGGAEACISSLVVGGFCAARALSTRNDDAATASRPWDVGRDGFVLGEGAGMVVLEELEHAQARGARIYAEALGVGMTADAYHITAPAPNGEGAARAMRRAVEESELPVERFDYINAHGTSTPFNDEFETMAIKSVFGDHAHELMVGSTKSMTGHLLGGAGGLEFVITSMVLHEGNVPPTINLENPDPLCDLDYVPNTMRRAEVGAALTNSFGFGGHNASLALGKYEE